MTERTGYLSGAALIVAGAACLVVARGAAPLPLVAYLVVQAVVLRWGMLVYGAPGAVGAVALSAFAPPLIAGDGGIGAAAGWTLAAFTLSRCLLDPTVQWALAIAAAGLLALVLGGSHSLVVPLLSYSAVLALWRAATAERWERRGRVLQAGLVAAAAGWGTLALLLGVFGHCSHLPEVDDISRRPASVQLAAAPPADAAPRGGAAPVALVPLLLAALRPWRPQRRYSDGAWIAAVVTLLLAPPPGGWAMAVTPFFALLAGASWDAARPLWARRAAGALVAAQALVGLAGLLAGRAVPPADGQGRAA
ncbi:MAG: hypothetical protein SF182_26290 [Deltaproteobacteria bacterium]|nr:hypothetical protein [Deltaproteobacteria bacterium]